MKERLLDLRQTPAQLREVYGEMPPGSHRRGTDRINGSIADRFVMADGTLEALKSMALGLMVFDHINKFFYGERLSMVFALGRLVMPIFGFVLVYNLARPGALERGVHQRMMGRLAAMGVIASPMAIALNATLVSHNAWWPLNILWTLFLVVSLVYLIERGGAARYAIAVVVFVVAGTLVEYLWLGVLACLGAWLYCREASNTRLLLWFLGTFSLSVVNANAWALLAIPLVWAASKVSVRLPRSKWFFYGFYPAHLGVLLLVKQVGLNWH